MSEPGGLPEAGWWGILAGVITLLGGWPMIGKAAGWFADRAEKRKLSREGKLNAWHAELSAREGALDQKLRAGLAECERQCAAARQEMEALREDNRIFMLAMGLAVPKLAAAAPGAPELGVIRSLISTRFAVDPGPAELKALMALLDPHRA